MDPVILGSLGIVILVLAIFCQVPVAAAMALVGGVGYWLIEGDVAETFSLFGTESVSVLASDELIVIPLFLLLGAFATTAGLSREIYRMAESWVGHLKGGLAMATIGASAAFGSICGSSVATTATMVRLSVPEMRRLGYSNALIAGSIVGGGTLGSLIPPSIIMVVYAVLTQQNIVPMFIAALIPGLLALALYFMAAWIYVLRNPDAASVGERHGWKERASSVWGARTTVLIAVVILGGIYSGVFSVNEAAAIGVAIVFATNMIRGTLNRESFIDSLRTTATNVGMIYLILIGANVFKYFMAVSGLPQLTVEFVASLGLPNVVVIFVIVIIYILLGSIFDAMAAMILTMPFVFPLVTEHLGYDPIWWGIINVMIIEIGMITPPVGINLFVLRGMQDDIPMGTIYRGAIPFVLADIVRISLVILFPQIILWLPQQLAG